MLKGADLAAQKAASTAASALTKGVVKTPKMLLPPRTGDYKVGGGGDALPGVLDSLPAVISVEYRCVSCSAKLSSDEFYSGLSLSCHDSWWYSLCNTCQEKNKLFQRVFLR